MYVIRNKKRKIDKLSIYKEDKYDDMAANFLITEDRVE